MTTEDACRAAAKENDCYTLESQRGFSLGHAAGLAAGRLSLSEAHIVYAKNLAAERERAKALVEALERMKLGTKDGRSQDDWSEFNANTLSAFLATIETTRQRALAAYSKQEGKRDEGN